VRHELHLCASRFLDGPFTLGRELLRVAHSSCDTTLSRRGEVVLTFLDPGAAVLDERSARPLSLAVHPEYRTRHFSPNHLSFLCHAASSLLEEWIDLADLRLHVCHLELADETDRELLRVVQERAAYRAISDPVVSVEETTPSDCVMVPDVLARHMKQIENSRHGVADRAWHEARAQEIENLGSGSRYQAALVFHLLRGENPEQAIGPLRSLMSDSASKGFYAAALAYGRILFGVWDRPAEYDATYHSALRDFARALTASGEADEAHAVYRRMLDSWGHDPWVRATTHYAIAMLFARHFGPARRDINRAVALLNEALATTEQIADPRQRSYYRAFLANGMAFLEVRNGNVDGAMKSMEDDLRVLDGDLADLEDLQHRVVARNNRATLLSSLRRHEEALTDLDFVVEKDPYTAEYRVERAVSRHAVGRTDEALRDLDFAIAHCVTGAEAYYNRAVIRIGAGDLGGALDDLRFAHHIDPFDIDTTLLLGELLLDAGMTDQAAALFDARGPSADWRTAVLSARVQLARDDAEGALQTVDTALGTWPESAPLHAERSAVLYALNRLDAALTHLDEARRLSAGPDPTIEINRVLLLTELGRPEQAAVERDRLLAEESLDERLRAQLLSLDARPGSAPGAPSCRS
jgi:tetratricopeptide (TPR) repeat protein